MLVLEMDIRQCTLPAAGQVPRRWTRVGTTTAGEGIMADVRVELGTVVEIRSGERR